MWKMTEQFKRILDKTHGPENYQIYQRHETPGALGIDFKEEVIVLKYPQITIRNARGSRQVEDVYVRIIPGLHAIHFLFAICGQGHGHVNGNYCNFEFTGACFGSGPLQLVAAKFWRMTKDTFKEQVVHEFLVTLKAFLEWENLGDMMNRQTRGGSSSTYPVVSNPLISQAHMKVLMRRMAENPNCLSMLRFASSQKTVVVSATEEFEKALAQEIISLLPKRTTLLATKNASGHYCKIVQPRSKPENVQRLFKFNGKHIYSKTQKDVNKKEDYVAHPKITKRVLQEIRKNILRKITKPSPGKRNAVRGAGGDKSKAAKSNHSSVQAGSAR